MRYTMKSIQLMLLGMAIMIVGVFLMGICIINWKEGGPEGLTLSVMIIGAIVTVIGFIDKD